MTSLRRLVLDGNALRSLRRSATQRLSSVTPFGGPFERYRMCGCSGVGELCSKPCRRRMLFFVVSVGLRTILAGSEDCPVLHPTSPIHAVGNTTNPFITQKLAVNPCRTQNLAVNPCRYIKPCSQPLSLRKTLQLTPVLTTSSAVPWSKGPPPTS